MNQKTMKIVWVFFLAVCAAFATVQAQSSYRTALDRGNRALNNREYEEAIRQFRAARAFNDARAPAIRSMLDGKIEESQNKRIAQLEEDKKREATLRAEADQKRKEAEESRKKAYDLNLRLLTSKVETDLKASGNFTLGMRLTAFAMRCIDPGNPIFLQEFMKAYNASKTAPAIIPIPKPWRYKMASFQDFAISGNARAFAMCSFTKPNLTIFRLDANGAVACTDSLDYKPWLISLSHDGNQLAFYTYDPKERGQVFIIKGLGAPKTARQVDTITLGAGKTIRSLAYYSNSDRLAINCKDSTFVYATDKIQRVYAALHNNSGTIKPVAAVAPKAANTLAEAALEDIVVWDCSSGKMHERLVLNCLEPVSSFQIIWNKNIALTGSKGGTLKIWNLDTGEELNSANVDNVDKDPVYRMAVSSDGKYIATALSNGRVVIWELAKAGFALTPALELPIHIRSSYALGLEFLPGTLKLLVAFNDGNAYLWDLAPKAVEENLRGNSAALTSKEFPPELIERFNLYDIFAPNANDWGIDSLINSRDVPIITGMADYLLEKKCRTVYSYEQAEDYFKQAERLYKALLRLDNSEENREKIASFYTYWAETLLNKGRLKESGAYLDKALELNRATPKSSEARIVEAHIRLLTGKLDAAIQIYNSLIDPTQQGKEVKNDATVGSFRRLSRTNIWAKDRSQQKLVEKALRLIGVPLISDTSLAKLYGIAPLQTRNIPLGELIAAIKGPDSLTKKQVLLILGIYNNEVKEEIGPKVSEFAKREDFVNAGLWAIRHAALLREIYSAQENSDNKKNLAEALGNVSYYLLFSQQYREAIRAAEDAFALSNQYWLQTNRAHAYLLSGNKAKALEIYKDIKGRPDETKRNESKVPPLREAILSDLETLLSKGIRHEDFPEVAALVLDRPLTDEERVKYGGKN
ncbi:MAG: hypothetical protein IPH12_19010 [Saprospirales bacterium]|nr:hypothetical protein [Saprospirales bacterium]